MGREGAVAVAAFLLIPLATGLFLAIFVPHTVDQAVSRSHLAAWLFGVGFLLFVLAKTSVIRRGTLFSFGSANMSRVGRSVYRVGYILMAFAAGVAVAVLKGFGSTVP